MSMLQDKLSNKKSEYYPILGKHSLKLSYCLMDFTVNNTALLSLGLQKTEVLTEFIFNDIKSRNADFGIGGYGENRAIYARSEHFNNDDEPRTIHLGIDIWMPANTPIYVPFKGKIHSVKNNIGFGDYGPTIILEHKINGLIFYSLYGHLNAKSLDNQYIGKKYNAGEILCEIGNFPENGDWPPHLHFQLIDDLEGNFGDYLGVCKASEQDYYLVNCPDPNLILRIID